MKKRYFTAICIIGLAGLISFSACNPRQGYHPYQPIAFSHPLHVDKVKIPCQYCHVSVDDGPRSSIPAINTCMNCHSQVHTQAPGVKKLRDAWESGTPIKWVRVYWLPEFVHFSHTPHISRGLECKECHGDLATQDVVTTQNPFNMGWCIHCHRNPPVEGPKGPTDCDACHY